MNVYKRIDQEIVFTKGCSFNVCGNIRTFSLAVYCMYYIVLFNGFPIL